jgi:hypothetical protein
MIGYVKRTGMKTVHTIAGRTKARFWLFGVALIVGSLNMPMAVAQTATEPDAPSVIRSAFKRYHRTWYRSLTFVQHTIRYRSRGTADTAVWYEAYRAPGRLRIDIAPLSDRSIMLFANDSQYVFQRDSLRSARPFIHPLLLLGFDLYHLPPEETMQKLKDIGFDLSIVRRDYWGERPVFVIGAHRGDTTSTQFWIDAERFVFLRMLMPTSNGLQEVQFNRYRELGEGWIAPEVVIALSGRTVMKEIYSEIEIGASFDDAFFDPTSWRSAQHWRR